MPSVVNIATTELNDYRNPLLDQQYRRFFGLRAPVEGKVEGQGSIGSGVIIDEVGYLITNLHVVSNTFRVLVKLANGEVYEAEKCVGTSIQDIALLKIKAPEGKKFKAMKFAPDDDLLLGESVIAMGNPYGLGGSVSRGILSSKNRRPDAGPGKLEYPDWLQTDADINPGNSGGPLINLRGEMIGINARVYREQEGMGVGFAIPVKQVSAALSEFFTPEVVNSLWFGAEVSSFDAPLTVRSVQPGSPAEQAGLRVDQRIVSVNGNQPRTLVDFQRLIVQRSERSESVAIQIEDHGQTRTLTAKLVPYDELTQQRLGMVLRNITFQTQAAAGAVQGEAVMIDQVEKGSPADVAKLQPGFIITGIDTRRTGYLLDAAKVISTKKSGDPVEVTFVVPRSSGAGAGQYRTTLTVR